jgi:ATP-dependent protease HslVU (ClpYQ) ATPase subunit
MNLSPKQIVEQLDKYIIGQKGAKKAEGNAVAKQGGTNRRGCYQIAK